MNATSLNDATELGTYVCMYVGMFGVKKKITTLQMLTKGKFVAVREML